jgi:hypothetical protein
MYLGKELAGRDCDWSTGIFGMGLLLGRDVCVYFR